MFDVVRDFGRTIVNTSPDSIFSIDYKNFFTDVFSVITISTNLSKPLASDKLRSSVTPNEATALTTPGVVFSSENVTENVDSLTQHTELSSFRFTRFTNPLVNYDYKCGHYLGIWDKLYPNLITSFVEVTRGIRKPAWFFSDKVKDLFLEQNKAFMKGFANDPAYRALAEVSRWYSAHATPFDSYFTAIFSFNSAFGDCKNSRCVATTALSQKLRNMFFSSTIQQRVLGN